MHAAIYTLIERAIFLYKYDPSLRDTELCMLIKWLVIVFDVYNLTVKIREKECVVCPLREIGADGEYFPCTKLMEMVVL